MEFKIFNKWISFGGSSCVKDMDDNDYLKVKGKIFTFTKKKEIYDMEGSLIYTVRCKFFSLFDRSAFVFDKDGNQVALVKRKVISLHDRYFVECDLGELEIVGNIFQFDYHIKLNQLEIGHVSRKISLRDSFVLSIDEKMYDPKFFVALVIAIDNITDRKDENRSSNNNY